MERVNQFSKTFPVWISAFECDVCLDWKVIVQLFIMFREACKEMKWYSFEDNKVFMLSCKKALSAEDGR